MSPSTLSRRGALARLVALLAIGAPGALAHAGGQGRYAGIQKVEVFTHVDVPITQPKKPPFELKVYRLDGMIQADAAMDRLTPKNLSRTERVAWQKNYAATHPEFTKKWDPLIGEAFGGMILWRDHYSIKAHGRIPAIVINGDWVMINETDVDRAIGRFHAQNR